METLLEKFMKITNIKLQLLEVEESSKTIV